jgi:chromosomal replication initiator protein
MDLDPRLTFESFVVGPANRLAAAAARRAADVPGKSYNPLFLYSASGLGKSHILMAIGHQALKRHSIGEVVYQSLEVYLGEITKALGEGHGRTLEDHHSQVRILLVDDVQFLAGQRQAQEMLLRTMDTMTSRQGQVVLASDRPPSEIDGLDARLMSRFSGGLIVDMGPPDLETRVAILRRKAEEKGATLAKGVPEALARFPFQNVREMEGALNRIVAMQDLEERAIEIADLAGIVRVLPRAEDSGEGGGRSEERWQSEVRSTVGRAKAEGFLPDRIERLLHQDREPADWEAQLRRFRADLTRIGEIHAELDTLGNPWPEAAATLLRDPDRLEEAEALLASARERARPFDAFPPGPRLSELEAYMPALAVRAADRLTTAGRPDFNPLFLHSGDADRGRRFLEAVGRSYLEAHPEARVGMISVPAFAEEFVRAISDGVAGAWRERWWTVEVLLLHGLESLAQTERAQEEFFHLFEALKRRDARIFLAADRSPQGIERIDERLRSRFEGGLVIELEGPPLPEEVGAAATHRGEAAGAAPREATDPATSAAAPPTTNAEGDAAGPPAASDGPPAGNDGPPAGSDDLKELLDLVGVSRAEARPDGAAPPSRTRERTGSEGEWRPSPEKVVWHWPSVADRILEES